MKREIKYEAWDSLNNKMLSWNDIGWKEINEDMSVHSLLNGEYAHFKPREYTGIKDKNGKEIYEGDIVQHRIFGDKLDRGEVSIHPTQGVKVGNWPLSFEHEVVGNIYETPDLLAELEGKR